MIYRTLSLLILLKGSLFCQPLPVVTTWYGDKDAAVSITLDDNMPKQLEYAAPELLDRGLPATWYVVSSRLAVDGMAGWDTLGWEPLDWDIMLNLHQEGHEIGGHSVNHNGHPAQIKPCLDTLRHFFPEKTWFTWAYVVCCCVSNEARTQNISARKCHNIVEESVPEDMWNVGSIMPPWNLEERLNEAIGKNGWMVELIHCIARESEPDECSLAGGYWLSQFQSDLDLLVDHAEDIWVGTFGDVSRYIHQRQAARIELVSEDSLAIEFSFTDTLADSIFNHPLTLKLPVPSGWEEFTVTQGINVLEMTLNKDTVWFDAIPGDGPITVNRETTMAVTGKSLFIQPRGKYQVEIKNLKGVVVQRFSRREATDFDLGKLSGPGVHIIKMTTASGRVFQKSVIAQ